MPGAINKGGSHCGLTLKPGLNPKQVLELLLTPSCVSCHDHSPLSAQRLMVSWSHRAVWPLPRTCPDQKDLLQTEQVHPYVGRDPYQKTPYQEQT